MKEILIFSVIDVKFRKIKKIQWIQKHEYGLLVQLVMLNECRLKRAQQKHMIK